MKLLHIAIALCIIVIGCSISGGAVLDDTIEIGAIQALTGDTAAYGEWARNGIDLAVQRVNAEGGIDGKKLIVIYEDGECEQSKGVIAAQKLINVDDVPVIIGPTCSGSAMAVAPIAEESETVMVVTIASVVGLRDQGDFIFRNRVTGDVHGETMGSYAYEQLGARKAASLYLNLNNGIDYKDGFEKRFAELGGTIIASESYERDDLDLRTQLLKIKEAKPDVVYLAGQVNVGNAVKRMREMGIYQQIVGPTTLEQQDLIDTAGQEAEGIIYTHSAFETVDHPDAVTFKETYEEAYGEPPVSHAATSYDALMLVADALRACREDTRCIRDFLYATQDYPGVSGLTSFDEDGEARKPLIFKTVQDGTFVRASLK